LLIAITSLLGCACAYPSGLERSMSPPAGKRDLLIPVKSLDLTHVTPHVTVTLLTSETPLAALQRGFWIVTLDEIHVTDDTAPLGRTCAADRPAQSPPTPALLVPCCFIRRPRSESSSHRVPESSRPFCLVLGLAFVSSAWALGSQPLALSFDCTKQSANVNPYVAASLRFPARASPAATFGQRRSGLAHNSGAGKSELD
jgi:hypothetical protein